MLKWWSFKQQSIHMWGNVDPTLNLKEMLPKTCLWNQDSRITTSDDSFILDERSYVFCWVIFSTLVPSIKIVTIDGSSSWKYDLEVPNKINTFIGPKCIHYQDNDLLEFIYPKTY